MSCHVLCCDAPCCCSFVSSVPGSHLKKKKTISVIVDKKHPQRICLSPLRFASIQKNGPTVNCKYYGFNSFGNKRLVKSFSPQWYPATSLSPHRCPLFTTVDDCICTCLHSRQAFRSIRHVPFSPVTTDLAPDCSMPEAQGFLQILWSKGSSHAPPGPPRHHAEPRSGREAFFFPFPRSHSDYLV